MWRVFQWIRQRQYAVALGLVSLIFAAYIRITISNASADVLLLGVILFSFVYVLAPTRAGAKPPEVGAWSRKCSLRIGVLTFILLSCVVGVNYFANPYGIYPPHIFDPIILNSADAKMTLYDHLRVDPRIIVYGSSRTFTMPPSYISQLTGASSFNASIESARPGEFLAFTRYTAVKGALPQTIILGIGIEQLVKSDRFGDDNVPNNRLGKYFQEQQFLQEQQSFFHRLQKELSPFLMLGSLDQTEASVKLVGAELKGRPTPRYYFDPDGLGHYHDDHASAQELADQVNRWVQGFDETSEALDDREMQYLEQLLQICRDHHIQVLIYLPPYQPEMLARLEKTSFPAARTKVLDALKKLQSQYGFAIDDFEDIASFGGREDLFIDGVHPKEEMQRVLLDVMLKNQKAAH
jgi:hypothetical protein